MLLVYLDDHRVVVLADRLEAGTHHRQPDVVLAWPNPTVEGLIGSAETGLEHGRGLVSEGRTGVLPEKAPGLLHHFIID